FRSTRWDMPSRTFTSNTPWFRRLCTCDVHQHRLIHLGGQPPDYSAPVWLRNWASTSSCRCPLVHTTLPPPGVTSPSSEVNRPPASVTMTCSAARSHRFTSGSAEMSQAPSATSMCDQKSPNARVRHTDLVRPRKLSSSPRSVQPPRLE